MPPISKYPIPETPAIYMLTFDGKDIYCGGTSNVHRRIRYHFWKLKRGTHKSIEVQELYDTSDRTKFGYRVVEYVNKELLDERERYWTSQSNSLLNSMPLGQKWKDHTLAKKSAAAKRQMSNHDQYARFVTSNRINSEKIRRRLRGLPEEVEDVMRGIQTRGRRLDKYRVRLSLVENGPRVDLGTYKDLELAQLIASEVIAAREVGRKCKLIKWSRISAQKGEV